MNLNRSNVRRWVCSLQRMVRRRFMCEGRREQPETPRQQSVPRKIKPRPNGRWRAWRRSLVKSMLRPSVTVLWPLPSQLSQARLLSLLRRAEIMLRAGYSVRVLPMQCAAPAGQCRCSVLPLEMQPRLRASPTREQEAAESMRNVFHHANRPSQLFGGGCQQSYDESPNDPSSAKPRKESQE